MTTFLVATSFWRRCALPFSAPAPRRRRRPSGKLVLYTSQPERDATQTVAAFKRVYPGVEVDVFRSGTTEVMGKLAAEFSAGAPKADVLLLADAATMEALKKDGRLLPYREAKVDGLDPGTYRRRSHVLRLQAHHDGHRRQHGGEDRVPHRGPTLRSPSTRGRSPCRARSIPAPRPSCSAR